MNKTELDFQRVMKDIGFFVIKSSKEEDIKDHIDFYSENRKFSFDVKGEKKLNRKDKSTDSDIIWIENKNVRGDKGWLYGKATHIVFELDGYFNFISRCKLASFMEKFIDDKVVYNKKEYKKWYRRKGRKDIITFIYKKDINHLIEKRVKITNNDLLL